MVAMLNEKKRIELEKQRALVYILNGGRIDEEEDSGSRTGVPGIDFPASDSDLAWVRN